jgi:hypothetical protein
MSLKRYVIIHHPVISEDRTTGLKLAAVVDENIPEVMPDLVTEMSQQRPIWLIHFQAPALALDTFRPVNATVITPLSWPVVTLWPAAGLSARKLRIKPCSGSTARVLSTATANRTAGAWRSPASAIRLAAPDRRDRARCHCGGKPRSKRHRSRHPQASCRHPSWRWCRATALVRPLQRLPLIACAL